MKKQHVSGTNKLVHICATCLRQIRDEYYIQCKKCQGFIQCLECFAYGYEKDRHLRSHSFFVMNPQTEPVFAENWTIEEELLLLNAIELCGIDNWVEIAKLVKSKSMEECEAHYYNVYINIINAPKPEITVRPPAKLPPKLPFSTVPIESRPSDGNYHILEELKKNEKTTPAEYNGYMPRRQEFEETYNDDAEILLNGMSFDDNDSQTQIDAKLELLICYNTQLKERAIRTQVIIDWDIQYHEFKGITNEREIDAKLIPLIQYLGHDRTVEIAKKLLGYLSLCKKYDELSFWRANGIKTVQEGRLYQALDSLIKDGKITKSGIDEWNRKIEEYYNNSCNENIEAKLLNHDELNFIKKYNLELHMYLSLKDLLLREYAFRGKLTKKIAIQINPENAKYVDPLYDLFAANGWIT